MKSSKLRERGVPKGPPLLMRDGLQAPDLAARQEALQAKLYEFYVLTERLHPMCRTTRVRRKYDDQLR